MLELLLGSGASPRDEAASEGKTVFVQRCSQCSLDGVHDVLAGLDRAHGRGVHAPKMLECSGAGGWGEDFGDVAGLDSHGALGGEGDEARSGFSGDLKFERNEAVDLISVGGRSTNLNENSMRPSKSEHERADGVALSKQLSEETNLRADLHVRL